MPRPKTGKRAALQKRAAIYRRHLDGVSYADIAEEFGISKKSVECIASRMACNDERVLAGIRNEQRIKQLELYEWATGELVQSWQKSKQLSERLTETGPDDEAATGTYEVVKERKNHGEVKYLTEARHMQQAVAELIGLNEPKTQINTNINAHSFQVVETIVVSREDIAKVRLEEQKALEDKSDAAPNAT